MNSNGDKSWNRQVMMLSTKRNELPQSKNSNDKILLMSHMQAMTRFRIRIRLDSIHLQIWILMIFYRYLMNSVDIREHCSCWCFRFIFIWCLFISHKSSWLWCHNSIGVEYQNLNICHKMNGKFAEHVIIHCDLLLDKPATHSSSSSNCRKN